MKYVLVSGGVISGVGKGIIASSTGLLLKSLGLKVSSIKIDPYLNVDAGTMNPKEHGEVFVLDDGGEVDLDLGNYERYLNITLTRENNITTGKIYAHVIEKERRGDYLGHTVQVVPHVIEAIEDWVERVAKVPVDDTGEEPDVCIIELGGTVGDIESMPFVEAMTQLRVRAGRDNFMQIHVSYVPMVHGEQKTKPTQMAIKAVRSAGLVPDLIACRCESPLDQGAMDKIARFCQVPVSQVLAVRDMPSTYQVPILLSEQGLLSTCKSILRLDALSIRPSLVSQGSKIWSTWKDLAMGLEHIYDEVKIVLVGKYLEQPDSYLSVVRSLEHASMKCKRKLKITMVDAEHLESAHQSKDPAAYHKAWHNLCTASGILVPGGFGTRGTEGMICAARWARENKIPYLGICLGMQIAVIEFARHKCGIQPPVATSEEFDPSDNDRIIISMPEHHTGKLGGTMRLGLRPTIWQEDSQWSRLRALYNAAPSTAAKPNATANGAPVSDGALQSTLSEEHILERHRHRYEVNPSYISRLEKEGLTFIGKDETGVRMEIIELKEHPWFVGVQFHPEYLSRVLSPSKPYLGFIAASAGLLSSVTEGLRREKLDIGFGGADINGNGEAQKAAF
ncbi:CTP synthase [Myriangium duriaei CBS 260.36]|uniref:CTP synthase n=1 Tax=Myriangium duriaei CBS 260.36 TaxID=1168546 RepID=A0A9P4JBR3_9PEZI|nr:CTP synthase [Myriangium duriaei CBS 260.36]